MSLQNRFAANASGIPDPRHEVKYFISLPAYYQLRSVLSPVLYRDRHADARGEYFIRSLYFDDAYDSAYYQKISGIEIRNKYRIRIYNCSDELIFLERKHKHGDLISKDSVRITRRLCDQLIEGRCDGLHASNNQLLQDMFREMRTRALRPRVLVDYTREAFTHPAEDIRITFDKDLRSGLFSHDLFNAQVNGVPPLVHGKMILEVKYNRYLPEYIRSLLSTVPSQLSAISKYTLCRSFEPLGE